MSSLPFLERYSGQSTDQLIALEGEYRIDSIVGAFEEAVQQKRNRLGAEALTGPESVIVAVEAMEREVNNGGFDQFFVNTSREHASVLVDSLEAINCPRAARIAQRAIEALRLDGPVTAESIDAAIASDVEGMAEALHGLDEEYYDNSEPIADNLFQYIKIHAAEIRLP